MKRVIVATLIGLLVIAALLFSYMAAIQALTDKCPQHNIARLIAEE